MELGQVRDVYKFVCIVYGAHTMYSDETLYIICMIVECDV